MLTEILSRDECANCRFCCAFDSYDIWETPVITQELASKIRLLHNPSQEFIQKGNCYILKLSPEDDSDLFYCSMLDKQKGCMLGDEKPFDCKIWPFRIMNFQGRRVITVSPVCSTVYNKKLSELMEFAKKLSPLIFEQADLHPEIIKDYMIGHPILLIE